MSMRLLNAVAEKGPVAPAGFGLDPPDGLAAAPSAISCGNKRRETAGRHDRCLQLCCNSPRILLLDTREVTAVDMHVSAVHVLLEHAGECISVREREFAGPGVVCGPHHGDLDADLSRCSPHPDDSVGPV